MSLFRIVKYSSILFFLGKYKVKLFRVIAVLLFAGITSVLYGDVADYLQQAHPGVVIYALVAKILIVYGSFVFVLWQFRPQAESKSGEMHQQQAGVSSEQVHNQREAPVTGPLSALEDVSQKRELRSRYDAVLKKGDRSI